MNRGAFSEFVGLIHDHLQDPLRLLGHELAGRYEAIGHHLAVLRAANGTQVRLFEREAAVALKRAEPAKLLVHPLDGLPFKGMTTEEYFKRRGLGPEPQWRRDLVKRGCIGVTMEKLTEKLDRAPSIDKPPWNLAFMAPDPHRRLAALTSLLEPGDVATLKIKLVKSYLDTAIKESFEIKEKGEIRRALERAMVIEKEAWSKFPPGIPEVLKDLRFATQVEGSLQTLRLVQGYRTRFEDIIRSAPPDVPAFMEMVRRDPWLAPISDGIEEHLPPGDPADYHTVIIAKNFWPGQDIYENHRGRFPRATDTYDPASFAPDPRTGKVNMAGAHYLARPGPDNSNFDLGFYDDYTATIIHADHRDTQEKPMTVLQSSLPHFFANPADYHQFHRAVIGLVFI